MEDKLNRRSFLGLGLGASVAIGAGAGLIAMKKSWNPLPSVISAGFTTVDTADMKDGDYKTAVFRGVPVYIVKKSQGDMKDATRDVVIADSAYSIGVQVCTHLGCIPKYLPTEKEFLCACHGGKFDINGKNVANTPPPTPMTIPQFKIDGSKIVFGEEGEEYKKLIAAK